MLKAQELVSNNLVYTLPVQDTQAIQRNDMRNYFDQRSYKAGQTARATFQTASRYVDVLNSQLVFTVKCSLGPDIASWGQGSALNLIKNVRVYHKNGTELVNIQNHNVNQMIEDKSSRDRKWMDSVGWLMGYKTDNDAVNGLGIMATPVRKDPTVEGQQIIIPLSCIAPCFNPSDEVLMPSVLASGLILEIDLANDNEAIVRTGDDPVTLDIENIYLNLSTTVLSDIAVATLNDVAAKSLIEYTYVDTYTSRVPATATTQNVVTSVNKAVSFADHIVSGEVISSHRNNQTEDEFKLAFDECSYQYQLGSVQLPSQVFTDSNETRFVQYLRTYNKYRIDSDPPAASYVNWSNNLNTKTTSFSKDQMMALSQLPINSSRSLRYEQRYDAAPGADRLIYVFLHYLKVLRVSLTDCSVNF
jgi:hypothetical protein